MAEDSSDDKPTAPAGAKPLATIVGDSPSDSADTVIEEGVGELSTVAAVDLKNLTFADRYAYETMLGRGGMGEVLAYRDRRMGRTIAIKLAQSNEDEDRAGRAAFTARFVHEARVQARLEHPSIVPVYDLGLDSRGEPYFTMKRVRGLTLSAIIEGIAADDPEIVPRFGLRRLLTAFSQVALAVDFAHEKGVVHRDLKPANIMLGDFGEVYVLDWGVASTQDTLLGEDGSGVRVGVAGGGTSGYMAPERVEGGGDEGPETDVYSLGAILYELLTLTPLNPGATALARATAAVEGDHPVPSERAPQRDIPPELDVICMRATALQPAQRYQSARRLHDAIEAFLDGERDEAVRNELAQRHALVAREAADRLLVAEGAGGLEERSDVLREVGRALALDPNNEVARDTMVRLLTTPPTEAPPEVVARQDLAARQRRVMTGRTAVLAYLAMLLYWPFFLWAGIESATALVAFTGFALVSAAVCAVAVAKRGQSERLVVLAMLVSSAAVASVSGIFGPLVLTPAVIAVNSGAYAIFLSARYRGLLLLASLLALCVPLALEWVGLVAPFYEFSAEGMTIVPLAVRFDEPRAVVAILLAASIGSILTSVLSMARIGKALQQAEERLLTYTWHFRKLAPESVSAVTAVLSSRGRVRA